MKSVQQSIKDGHFLLDVEERDIGLVIQQAVSHLVAQQVLPVSDRDAVEAALLDRERLSSTAIGLSVAVPHAYLPCIESPVIMFVRLARPLNLGAPDGVGTRFVFLLLGPPDHAAEHLDSLATIARMMSDAEFRYEASEAEDEQELLTALERFVVRTGPPPEEPDTEISAGLHYSGKLCGGLIADVRRRLPHYWSDFRDGLNTKSISSILFMYFACLAPAVTFGGIMAVQTQGKIGVVEMILATAACGIAYALFSGQPLVILGGTGPLLVFTAILYRMCGDMEIPFLATYAWVGLWTAAMVILLAITDASALMRYFTRFTNEIFAALIAIIFIYEAVKGIIEIFRVADAKQRHDTALLSLLLAVGTFYIAQSLSQFRRSRYLRPFVREFLADFGPTVALGAMTLIAVWLHEVNLEVLPAPDTFGTSDGRPWTVDLFAAPRWVWLAAAVPALLATVLVFLNQNITTRLVSGPDHQLKKGEAYHFDLAIVGLLIATCSMFGLPWLLGAIVPSLNHLRSLAKTEEVILPGGDRADRIVHVNETRVTGLAIHLLIGLSLFLLPVLKTIPMPVLFGLFFFMGIAATKGNQFLDRLSLWFMDSDMYPSTHYVRKLPRGVIHKYTVLQLICLVVLWVVKSSVLGILFPLFVALLAPIRQFVIGPLFTPQQLAVLDSDESRDE